MTTIEQIFINIFIIFGVIILSTFFQKYYYDILRFISGKSPKIIRLKINFITRSGIILHELSHAFFSFLSGHKIQEINLFSKNGGSVKYSYKNYIQLFGKGIFDLKYWILMILNQIGIFLTSFGPLIFGIILNYFFWNVLFGINLQDSNENFLEIFRNLDFLKIFYLILYFLLIPTFILSWKDISHFFISQQKSKVATFVGSTINSMIFVLFLISINGFVNHFIVFGIGFLVSFLFIIFVGISVKFLSFLKKLFLKKPN